MGKSLSNASNVEQSVQSINMEQSSAQHHAKENLTEKLQCKSSTGVVMSAEQYISTAEKTLDSARLSVESVTITSKKSLGIQTVYNFEVQESHNYILENGVVAHNCDLISQLNLLQIIYPPAGFEEDDEVISNPLIERNGIWGHHDWQYGDSATDNGAYSSYV